ncbi:PR domain zinc finger protein 8b [Corythoichthys intestinalis]|uniref:PR domain zinc finger protein 8b n=1 Tax=Corythoichthys intestinalis TaxID=161448 RepID=UPI0025A5E497|nr:PR domain zinc finger protein 8b [Corythoichthys intestinalis]XP_061811389.1 PR domain zinc finger protein 8-like [Nerophis lumbriciformis]
MEESSSHHKAQLWDGDAKAVQQCLTDIFTSVYTTCDVPESAIFGPCVLSHTSMYDSIAFIALKATDKRTAPYIFRVDTSAANSTSEGLMWLRLVQSARDKDEQNLEAYVKNGQLFYRSLRRIEKDEELLVWYGKDLVELLLLTAARVPTKSKGGTHNSCPDCNQRFQFEFPFLAHLRFRCTKRLQNLTGVDEEPGRERSPDRPNATPTRSSPKHGRSEGDSNKPSTDFHNLARDMENNRTGSPLSDREAEVCSESSGKRKFSAVDDRECRRPSLPQSKSKEELATSAQNYRGVYGLEENRALSSSGSSETKCSAFTEVKKSVQTLKNHGSSKGLSSVNSENKDRPGSGPSEKHLNIRQVLSETQPAQTPPMGSAFTSVSQAGGSERKSAFSQPARSTYSQISPLVMPPKLLDCHPAVGDTISSSRLYQADHLAAKLQGAELGANCPVPGGVAKQSPFVYAAAAAATFWPKNSGGVQLQMPSALTLLPPSFTSLCLPAQNWCAKCNASFRMTSDLVYHMRSHHKKEYAMEPLVKRRREEKLKCPICNESFRERHHLSRHMTSHN